MRSSSQELRVQVLGPVRAWLGDAEADLGPNQAKGLFAVLALAGGRTMTRHELVSALWGERPPASSTGAIQVHISRLRGSLEPERRRRTPSRLLPSIGDGYALRLRPDQVDALRFRDATARGAELLKAGEHAAAVALLGPALREWHPPLTDITSLADQTLTDALVEDRWLAQGCYADAAIAAGLATQAFNTVADAAAQRPFDESAQARLIRAYCAVGRRADAAEVFRRTRRLLAEELGIDPGQTLLEAFAEILAAGPLPDAESSANNGFSPVPRQLPGRNGYFAGRAALLSAIRAKLIEKSPRSPLVCLEGIGGVGKTTAAVEAAHDVANRFDDGQIFLDLAGHDPATAMSPGAALYHILRSLGVDLDLQAWATTELAAHYRTILSGKRLLLVLDNVRDTEQVLPLLPATPSCAVLVTSRRRLTGLAAQHVTHRFPVEALSSECAVELLTGVVGGARVEAEPEAAVELAQLCGYFPLALRLAAGRLLGAPDSLIRTLVRDLRDARMRLDTLSDNDSGDSIDSVFSWSYRSLPAPFARVFRLMSLHPGPTFTSDLVALTTNHTRDAAGRILHRLVATHLLESLGRDRYRFHDLIRLYASQMLAQDPLAGVPAQRRLLDWYVGIADAANRLVNPLRDAIQVAPPDFAIPFTQSAADAQDYLADEAPNFAPIVRYAATHGSELTAWQLGYLLFSFFVTRPLGADFHECAKWALVATNAEGDLRARALLLNVAGVAAHHHHEPDQGIEQHRQQLAIWQRLGDRQYEAAAWNNLGGIFSWQNKHTDALHAYQQALELWTGTANQVRCGIALGNIANAARDIGDLGLSLDSLQRAWDIWHSAGDRRGQGLTHFGLARTYYFAGRPDTALDRLRLAAETLQDLGQQQLEGRVQLWAGKILSTGPDPRDGLNPLDKATSLFAAIGDRHGEGAVATIVARVHLSTGAIDTAQRWLDRAWKLRAANPDPLESGRLHQTDAQIAAILGDRERAAEHVHLARRRYEQAACIESARLLTALEGAPPS